jgi:hypothetical protein
MRMSTLSIECEVHFNRCGRGRRELEVGTPAPSTAASGRVPRIARLLALAHRLDCLLRTGVVRDYAELARLGRVTRARISQIMALLLLAPDLQEQILFLPRTERGRDPVILHDLLPIAATADWRRQRRLWECFRRGGRREACDRPRPAPPTPAATRPPSDASNRPNSERN